MTLGVIIAIVVGLILLRFATKIIAKLIGLLLCVVAVIGIMYIYSWGPFSKNLTAISTLEEKYCEEEGGDKDICECVVAKIKLDVLQRFSNEEIKAIEEDKIKSFRVLTKSMEATKEESIACLTLRGEEDKYQRFLLDFAQLSEEDIDFIKDKGKEIGDWIKDKADSIGESLEDIDDRY